MTAVIMSYTGLDESCDSIFTHGLGFDSENNADKTKKTQRSKIRHFNHTIYRNKELLPI